MPPANSTAAADAIPAAEAHSAWQPPSAPDTVAFLTMTAPMPEAVSRALRIFLRPAAPFACFSFSAIRTAGIMPLAPAVGAAQMRPIEAFTSLTESARAITRLIKVPHKPGVFLLYALCRQA